MLNWTSLLHFSLESACLQKAEVMIPLYLKNYHHNLDIKIVYPKASQNAKPVYWWTFNDMSGSQKWYTIIQTCNLFVYLLQNAKKIEHLHLIHFIKSTFLYGLIYKILNQKGKLYIMMDFDPYKHNLKTVFWENIPIIRILIRKFINFFIRLTDCISIETTTWYNFLVNYNWEFQKKLVYMPNGFDQNQIDQYTQTTLQKENIIITVARIGSYQKNTELLMQSIAHLCDTDSEFIAKNWKCYCIGPIEDWFQNYINEFYRQHPKVQGRLFFTGSIFDKKELYSRYQKSKIFCLTSRHESFWIVLVEALYLGNYLITTDIASASDITNQGELWTIVTQRDYHSFAKAIENGILNIDKYTDIIYKTHSEIIKKFSWHSAILRIYNKLYK